MRTVIGARGRKCGFGRAGLILAVFVPFAAAMAPSSLQAQSCGLSAGGNLTGVLNSYYPGTQSAAVGATTIHVGAIDPAGAATPILDGDTLLIIQMQDAGINTSNNTNYGANAGTARGTNAVNNSGAYEYVLASSAVVGGVVTVIGGGGAGILNAYTAAAFGAQGQRTFQVIRVPGFASGTLTSGLKAAPWNGATGGVLALDISGVLTLGGAGGTVSVDGMGFRGGAGRQLAGDDTGPTATDYRSLASNTAHGSKAEGIAGTPRFVYNAATGLPIDSGVEGYVNGSLARGAPGNAGGGGTDPNPGNPGNDENSGGGGGANAGDGGTGGNSWTSNLPRGGIGGDALVAITVDRLILGGGGGAGDRNNCGPSHGGAGGGIVLFRAGSVAGTGTITARGTDGITSGQDGAGGGGGGGRVVVVASTGTVAGLTVNVSGGSGGWTNLNSTSNGGPAPPPQPGCLAGSSHGPGGGGGGGAVFVSSAPAASTVAGGPAGFTNTNDGNFTTLPINYGATAGAAGFTNIATTLAQLPGFLPCTAATRASVCGLRVDPAGTVEFATSSQRGSLAFNLYATADATGRSGLVKLTDHAIPAPVPSSGTPILYRAETAPITSPYLVIEEIETSGTRRSLGPFPVGDERLRLGFERIEKWDADSEGSSRLGARLLSSRRRVHARANEVRPRALAGRRGDDEAVKLEVPAAGLVRVRLADLVSAGLPSALVNRPDVLRVTNLGRSVPFRASIDSTGARAIEFTAEALSTDYSGRNPYVLSWGRQLPPAPSVPFTVSGFPRRAGFVRIEQNVFNAAFVAQGADPWIWDLLSSGFPSGPYAFDLPGLVAAGASVPVRVGLVGGSDHVHTVQAFINGEPAGTVTFEGKKPVLLEGTVPAGAVHESGNELSLVYTASPASDDDPGLVFLDVLDLGVSVAASAEPVPLDGIEAYDASLPAGAGADYLIVTHSAFAGQARRIASLKEAEGHRTWVVDVENAYDRFSGGVMEPAAVQALIRQAVRAGARYVLLVGDDTFDPRDFSGMGFTSYVPSLLGWDGAYGRVPSENKYADVDGDGLPDVAIGRLPVQTAEEADVLVDKIARQAAVMRAAGRRHLFVVDNQAAGDPSFSNEADRVATLLGASAQVSWADLAQGVDRAREDLLDGLASGPLATHYFGHGGEDFWADEHLLDAGEAASLPPNGRETVLFSWTCVSQNYLFGLGPSLSEALLLAPQAGALAAVGPTGITDAPHQAVLFSHLYPYLLHGVPLGEALRRAKVEALRADPEARPVIEGWSLLGDPALALPLAAPRR
jgi:peptidase C25-like protein